MDCPECLRLQASRDLQRLIYATAVSRLKSVQVGMDAAHYMGLQRKAMQGELALKSVDAEFMEHQHMEHQDRHAVVA